MRLLVLVRAAILSTRAPLKPLPENSSVATSMMSRLVPSGSLTRCRRDFGLWKASCFIGVNALMLFRQPQGLIDHAKARAKPETHAPPLGLETRDRSFRPARGRAPARPAHPQGWVAGPSVGQRLAWGAWAGTLGKVGSAAGQAPTGLKCRRHANLIVGNHPVASLTLIGGRRLRPAPPFSSFFPLC